LQLRANARQGVVRHELRRRSGCGANRKAHDEWKQSHEIKTRLTRVQPVRGRA
jgi:hypothetical protein